MQTQTQQPQTRTREPMTEARKAAFLAHLRRGMPFRRAALQASRCATSLEGAQASFRQAMRRDARFALRVAEVVHGR
jgi:hypothetical protein